MEMTWNEIGLLLPEIIVGTMACVVLVVDLYIREQRHGIDRLVAGVSSRACTSASTTPVMKGRSRSR
ncbi:MAG: hypothetical protein AAGE01_20210, partial [Pseudomonadota bacterium]